MALSNILDNTAKKLGVSLSDTATRTWLIDQINTAARELYAAYDLQGSVKEQVFQTDTGEAQATLPAFVGSLRAVRRYDSRLPVDLIDMAPRYHYDSWENTGLYKFRVKNVTPIQKHIVNTAPLTVSISIPSAAAISVTIRGATEHAADTSEVITIPAGSLTATGAVNFSPLGNSNAIRSISKPLTSVDVTISDVEGRVLALLPNKRRESRYVIVQLFDAVARINAYSPLIEVLYKEHLWDLVEDSDTLPIDGYDDAITWKVLENNTEDPEKVSGYIAKWKNLLRSQASETDAQERAIDLGPSRFIQDATIYASTRFHGRA